MPPRFGQAAASRTIGSGRPGFLPTCHLACKIRHAASVVVRRAAAMVDLLRRRKEGATTKP